MTKPGFNDPDQPQEKIMIKQIRAEIQAMKLTDPEKAEMYEEFVMKKNHVDEYLLKNEDLSEIKLYPGSDKGPLPSDDPHFYSKWFVDNQPKKLFAGFKNDLSEQGIKTKFILMQKENNENHEQQTMGQYFVEEDEMYPAANYDGVPEQHFLEFENFNVENEEEIPSLSFSSNMSPTDLPPLPPTHTKIYQNVHYELERWSVFRSLPEMMKFD